MYLIKPSVEIVNPKTSDEAVKILKNIESSGRVCYKSEGFITDNSFYSFLEKILGRGHEAVIEHGSMTVKIVCDRGVTHEIVRHRLSSYCQESTRYCNYSKDKFDNQLTFILPCWFENYFCGEYGLINDDRDILNITDGCLYQFENEEFKDEFLWLKHMLWSEKTYLKLISEGWKPEQARSVLPNSLKTEIVMTANLREWRHFFKLRTSAAAHPQMREIACEIKSKASELFPIIFG